MSALVDTTTRASEQNLSNLEKASAHDEKIHNDKHSTVTEVDTLEADVRPEFDDPNLDKEAAITGILEDDSPYPERAYFLIIIALLLEHPLANANLTPPRQIVAQLLTFPIGRAWGRFLPFGIAINPGPFSVKEHVLITIMACAGASSAYAIDIIAVQRVYYEQNYNFGYQWMVVMSIQLIGFSIGGIARRFLMHPPSMTEFFSMWYSRLYFPRIPFTHPTLLSISFLLSYRAPGVVSAVRDVVTSPP
ncbi:OPT oligopeptide transporter protein-domain-containing protein [Mycena rebaudengoi]|nr:OPT oligopeptide transporter protein-domain-containing protein [Mycena rebaudengoi]